MPYLSPAVIRICALYLLAATAIAFGFYRFGIPLEDAAILFRYSRNFAETGIISYNLNGPAVEGATDFLYMIFVAGLIKAGIPDFLGSLIINLASLLVILLLLRDLFGLNFWETAALALAHLLLPSSIAAFGGYSVLFFEMSIVLSIYFLVKDRLWPFFLSVLLCSLIRPDGVVFNLVAATFMLSRHFNARGFSAAFGALIVPGILYFVWRWQYFGEFLPLPFYVKSDVDRAVLGLNSWENIDAFRSVFSPA